MRREIKSLHIHSLSLPFTLSLSLSHSLSPHLSLSLSLSLTLYGVLAGGTPEAGQAPAARGRRGGRRPGGVVGGATCPHPFSLSLSLVFSLFPSSGAGAALEAAPAAAAPDRAGQAGGGGRKAGPRALEQQQRMLRLLLLLGLKTHSGLGLKTQPVKNPTRFHLKR